MTKSTLAYLLSLATQELERRQDEYRHAMNGPHMTHDVQVMAKKLVDQATRAVREIGEESQ